MEHPEDKNKKRGNGEKKEKYTIFIVDDDKFLLDMYATKFAQSGFDVVTAVGGIDALAKLESGLHPDIMVTDVVMPVMDGMDLLAEVKNKNLCPDSCIIVLSNLGQKEDVDKAVALGAVGYIVKATATPTEVVERVNKILKDFGPPGGGQSMKGRDHEDVDIDQEENADENTAREE